MKALHYALLGEEFQRLDEQMAWNLDSARADSGYELRYRDRLDVFAVADTTLAPHLDAWVAREPASSVARLARGAFYAAMSESARGSDWVSETTESRLRRMLELQRVAGEDLVAAHKGDSTNVLAHWLLLNIVMASGTHEQGRATLDAGLRQVPGSFLLRARYGLSLRPRWGGSLGSMNAFTRETSRDAELHPRLRLLRGYEAYDSASVLHEGKRESEAVTMYTRALSYGDYWLYRTDRADAHYNLEEYQLAIEDYDAALAQRPLYTEARVYRAASLDYLAWQGPEGPQRHALLERAREDMRIAAELDPTSKYLMRVVTKHPGIVPPIIAIQQNR